MGARNVKEQKFDAPTVVRYYWRHASMMALPSNKGLITNYSKKGIFAKLWVHQSSGFIEE